MGPGLNQGEPWLTSGRVLVKTPAGHNQGGSWSLRQESPGAKRGDSQHYNTLEDSALRDAEGGGEPKLIRRTLSATSAR